MTAVVYSDKTGIPAFATLRPFLRFLNLSGDGTTTNSVITGDYSGGEVDFFFQPPSGFTYKTAIILLTIADNANFNQGDYGGIVSGLTNGIKLFQRINGTETQLIGGFTIKKNYEFLAATNQALLTSFSGIAQTMSIAFDTYKDLGTYIDLNGTTADRLILRVHDNFTSLVDHRVAIRGLIQPI